MYPSASPTNTFTITRLSYKSVLSLGLCLLTLWWLYTPGKAQARSSRDPHKTTKTTPWAVMWTNRGTVVIRLYENMAPKTVAHFINLATGKVPWKDPKTQKMRYETPFYNGLRFFRVLPTYLIQAGCPRNRGTDGPGFTIRDEFHPKLRHRSAGYVGMANIGPHTSGSQFYVTLRSSPWLDPKTKRFQVCKNFRSPTPCRKNRDCQRYATQFPGSAQGPAICEARKETRGYSIFGKVRRGMDVLQRSAEVVDGNGAPLKPLVIDQIAIVRGKYFSRRWLKKPSPTPAPRSR